MTATTLDSVRFPHVQSLLATPGMLAGPIIVTTELILAPASPVRSLLTDPQTYYREMRALVRCAHRLAAGEAPNLPRFLKEYPSIGQVFFDSFELLVRTSSDPSDAPACAELWSFISVSLQYFDAPGSNGTGTSVPIQASLRQKVQALAYDHGPSQEGPRLFWEFMSRGATQKLPGLLMNPGQRFAVIQSTTDGVLAKLHGQLFRGYIQEGENRLG